MGIFEKGRCLPNSHHVTKSFRAARRKWYLIRSSSDYGGLLFSDLEHLSYNHATSVKHTLLITPVVLVIIVWVLLVIFVLEMTKKYTYNMVLISRYEGQLYMVQKRANKIGQGPPPFWAMSERKKSHAMCSLTFCNVVLQGSPWPSKLLQGSSIWQLDREGNLAKRTVVLRKNIIKLYLPKLIEKDCKSRKASLKIYLPATTSFQEFIPIIYLPRRDGIVEQLYLGGIRFLRVNLRPLECSQSAFGLIP